MKIIKWVECADEPIGRMEQRIPDGWLPVGLLHTGQSTYIDTVNPCGTLHVPSDMHLSSCMQLLWERAANLENVPVVKAATGSHRKTLMVSQVPYVWRSPERFPGVELPAFWPLPQIRLFKAFVKRGSSFSFKLSSAESGLVTCV